MDGNPQAHAVSAPLSRRRFLRNAAIAAGSVAALQVGGAGLARTAAAEAGADTLPADGVVTAVARSDDRIVAVGHDEQGVARVWHRNDSGEWVGSAPAGDVANATALGIAATGSGFVIVGSREAETEGGTLLTPAAWTSSDGLRWTAAETPDAPGVALDVAASGDGLVAVGSALDGETTEGIAPFVMASPDGESWEEVEASGLPSTPEGGLQGIAHRDGAWYALSLDIESAALWTSADGSSWSEHTAFPTGEAPAALADSPQGLLAVGATVPDAQPRMWRVTGGGAKEQGLPSQVADNAILRDIESVGRGRSLLVGQQDGRPMAADAEQ